MTTKPWREVQISEETGRFTREQIERAVRVVKERNAAKRTGAAQRSRGSRSARNLIGLEA